MGVFVHLNIIIQFTQLLILVFVNCTSIKTVSFQMEKHYYNTVVKPKVACRGYIRIHCSKSSIPKAIKRLCFEYLGYFFLDPAKDPANFITDTDIEKALKLKREADKLFKLKKFRKALHLYTQSLSYNINDGMVRILRSKCYLELGDCDKSLCDARYALRDKPTSPELWFKLAEIFCFVKEYSECLNIIDHCIYILEWYCHPSKHQFIQELHDKRPLIYNAKIQYYKLHPEKRNINHMNDKDRLEWQNEKGKIDESKLSDEAILDMMPWQIHTQKELIIPQRLGALISSDTYEELDEYERWTNRKWILKLNLFQKLNSYKKLFRCHEYINNNAPIKPFDIWSLTWSATHSLYLNKRLFSITIGCVNYRINYEKCVFMGHTYCKPTAKCLIQCVMAAILSPADNTFQIIEQLITNGLDKNNIKYVRRPQILEIAYRIRDEFDEIKNEMNKFGIECRFVSLKQSIESCRKYGTNVDGWNYLDLIPYYRYDKDNMGVYYNNLSRTKSTNKRQCEQCGKLHSKRNELKLCSRCKAVFYCNKHCQKMSWNSNHRYNCSE
eukprot:21094_1